jgi:zinc/manganese transport system substrate-binding protein
MKQLQRFAALSAAFMRVLILVLLSALFISQSVGADKIVVTSFSPLITEIVTHVGGEHIHVVSIMEPGMDPHLYQLKPSDLTQVAESDLVLLSGKHLEKYETNLQQSAGAGVRFLEVGNGIPSLPMQGGEHTNHADGGRPDHEHAAAATEDPHWWTSVENMKIATVIIRDALIEQRPTMEGVFRTNASAYIEKLETLRKWLRKKVAELPRDKRKLVTSHDAFQYFARENGFTVFPIEGLSTDEEPSNRALAGIIDSIRANRVKAVFVESTNNPKVVREITRETGAKLGGMLYADGLGEGDASTYEGMMKHNVTTIVDALK